MGEGPASGRGGGQGNSREEGIREGLRCPGDVAQSRAGSVRSESSKGQHGDREAPSYQWRADVGVV